MNLDTFFQIADALGIIATATLAFFAHKAIPQHAADKPYSLFSRFTKWTFQHGIGIQTFLVTTGVMMLALVVYGQLVWTAFTVLVVMTMLSLRLRKYYGQPGNARWAECR